MPAKETDTLENFGGRGEMRITEVLQTSVAGAGPVASVLITMANCVNYLLLSVWYAIRSSGHHFMCLPMDANAVIGNVLESSLVGE